MKSQLAINWPSPRELWSIAPREDSLAAELADRHYSRQTAGAHGFLAAGRCVVLYHRGPRGAAAWGVVYGVFREVWRWRNTIFRNESGTLSSALIKAATEATYIEWERKYGALPHVWSAIAFEPWLHVATGVQVVVGPVPVPLRTEVDIEATRARRSKRHEPGHCYLMAGWRKVREIPRSHGRSAKVELEAPR